MSILLAALVIAAKGPALLHVSGTDVLDDRNRPVRLRGVNVASLEWSSDGEGHVLETLRVATEDWKANIVRVPLSQDRWFGKAPEQKDGGKAYRALVRRAVDAVASHRAYVLLDLHWNDADEWGKNIGQHMMPDMNSVEFWKSCAREYRNHPAVLFDLYNEPHDITWDVWKSGGTVEEKSGPGARQGAFKPVTYRTPGMQALLETVRKAGANNVVVAGGLDWAYDLTGPLKGYALTDTKRGRGVIYACHSYPFKGDSVAKFLAKLDAALPKIPVIVSEFGANNRGEKPAEPNPWIAQIVPALQERKVHWTAWDLHPAAGPTLITGWDYRPTPSFGAVVKDALAK